MPGQTVGLIPAIWIISPFPPQNPSQNWKKPWGSGGLDETVFSDKLPYAILLLSWGRC